MTYISEALRRLVAERANDRCEYCQIWAELTFYPHEVDHVVALKHGGETEANNLAYACWRCNRRKGSDLGSFDPQTKVFSFLFNPRTQAWANHYAIDKNRIVGLSPEGRTTTQLLQLNSRERLAERDRVSN